MFFWQEGHQPPSLCALEGPPAEGFVDLWSERCLHLAISNSKGVGGGGKDFMILPLLNLNWAKWDACFLLGPVRSHRDATTISRGKLISAGTSIALGDTSMPLSGERTKSAKWSSATQLHLISGVPASNVMHCELLQSTSNPLSCKAETPQWAASVATHRRTVPLTLVYSPLHCLDSPESSGGPPAPEWTCPHLFSLHTCS